MPCCQSLLSQTSVAYKLQPEAPHLHDVLASTKGVVVISILAASTIF